MKRQNDNIALGALTREDNKSSELRHTSKTKEIVRLDDENVPGAQSPVTDSHTRHNIRDQAWSLVLVGRGYLFGAAFGRFEFNVEL